MQSAILPSARRTSLYLILFGLGLLAGAIGLRSIQYANFEIPVPSQVLADGAVYEGDAIEGVIHGRGRMLWTNGDHYEGEFIDGLFHGQGKFVYADGISYEGDYVAGQATGKGKWIYSDEEKYEGEVVDGWPNGNGVFESHGTLYEGEFVDNEFHGQGTYTDAVGNTYIGEFANGVLTGQGKYEGKDGTIYEGEFLDWLYHGPGELLDDQGGRYSGQFENGQLNGQGQFIGENGETYDGGFEYGYYSGEGKLVKNTGDVYQGGFSYGRYHGSGHLTYAKPRDNIDSIEGVWKRGTLVGVTNYDMLVNPEEINETVLYNQEALLEQGWSQLEANDPDKIDMYFLGISGDGSQAVFRREVQFVRNLFDEKFKTSQKSTALINARQTVREVPLATSTSIRRSLVEISNRMDAQNDILFIFMTSHGSSDFEFSLRQSQMRLPDLSATKLAGMLEDLPIRWKVVFISACYSGGFIPLLQSDETLIITAAAGDKTSFGCSDDAEFTYFGEAFFKDAMDETNDFVQAFDIALEIVKEREAVEGYDHSEPQIHKPEAIQKQLARWYSQEQ